MPRAATDQPAIASREHERAACRIPATALPAGAPDQSVDISSSRAHPDRSVAVTIVDVSSGGISMITEVFLPRGCLLQIRVPTHADAPSVVQLNAQVRNVAMIDRTPRYKLGLRLLGEDADRAERVRALLALTAGAVELGAADAGA